MPQGREHEYNEPSIDFNERYRRVREMAKRRARGEELDEVERADLFESFIDFVKGLSIDRRKRLEELEEQQGQ